MVKNINVNLSALKKNSNYYLYLILAIIFNSYISFDNISFDLYFNYRYVAYSNFFKTLDFSVFHDNYSTFPIWGYGLIHLLGSNKLLFLIIQQVFTFLTLIYFDSQILKFQLIKRIETFRLIIILSSPWFLFHTQMWEKSISSNLLILGLLILFNFLKTNRFKYLILSSIIFGVLSNFRSDYNYLYTVFFILIITNDKLDLKKITKKLIFPLTILLLLTPWMLFTYKQTDKPLLTSTNSGHVFLIGLGQLPNNSWGITPRDDDKIMDYMLREKFGANYESFNYKEDKYLKSKFKELITKNPMEWVKKCFYAFKLLLLDPFYIGNVGDFQRNNFSNVEEIRELEKLAYNLDINKGLKLIKTTKWELRKKEVFQLIFTFLVKFQGIVLIFSFFISLFLCLYKFGFNLLKDKLVLLFLLTVGYQISISVFAFHMPVYNNTIYLIYLLLTYLFFQKYLSIKQ